MANQQRWQANNRLARLLAGRSAPDDPQISALAQRRSAWVTPEGRANPPASPPHRRPRPRAIGPRGPRPAFESPTPRRSRRPSHFAPLASEEEVDDAFARGRLENARARAVKRPRRPSLFGPPAPDNAVVDIDALPAQQNPGSARARAGKRPSHFAAPAPENRIGHLYDFFTREISEQARARAGKRHAHFAPPAAGEAVIDIDDLLAHNSSESPRAGAGFVDSDNLRAARERSRQIERQILGLLSDARAKEQPPGRRDVQVHSPMSIPPRFRRQLGRELRRGDITPEILDYHENELVRRDSRGIPGMMGEKSLVEEILQSDAIERLRGRKGTGWRPLRSLGSGGQGGVILWEKIREEGPPLRLATKDMGIDKLFFRDYNVEGHITRRLNDAGCENVIKVLEWALLENPAKFRIAYEVADYGDLSDLIRWYDLHRLIFPEAFLWHVFHGLANVLTYCALGHTRTPDRLPEWEEIVHGDLKPANVLVASPNPALNKHYPTIKMADFGFAYTVPADRDDIRRYKSSWTYGTPGYRAPEIEQKVKGARRDQTPYTLHGSHTDVWSVGKIMMEMYVLVWRHYPADQAAAFRRGEAWAVEEHVYSTGLLALIARCMEADGRRRPTAWRVFDRTWRQVEARRDDLYADEVVSRSIGARNGLWSGKVLMEKEERRMYQDDPVYREAYRDVNLRGLFGKMGTAVETREEEGEFEVVSVPAQPGNVGGPQRGGQGGLVPALGNLNVGRRRKRASGEQRLRAARRARAMQDAMKVIYDPRDEV